MTPISEPRKGRIKSVNSRGFGFIETDEGIDFFFHYTHFQGSWKKLLAEYVVTPREKKLEVEFAIDTEAKDAPSAKTVKLV